MDNKKREPIKANSNFHIGNVFSPKDFTISYINVELQLSKEDLGGGADYIKELFEELAYEVIRRTPNE